MNPPDRKETEVRRMLDGPHPAVPPGLALRAAERGHRLLLRRRWLLLAGWLLLTVGVVLCVWALAQQPWLPPPTRTTPPLEGW